MPPTIAEGATPRITQMNYLLQRSLRTSEKAVDAKFAQRTVREVRWMVRRRSPPLRGSPFPRRSLSVVFFCRPPYLLRIDVLGEAGRHRPVRAAQDDHARIAQQVQRVARGQVGGRVVLAHQEEKKFAARRRRGGCILIGPWRSRPRYAPVRLRGRSRMWTSENFPSTRLSE